MSRLVDSINRKYNLLFIINNIKILVSINRLTVFVFFSWYRRMRRKKTTSVGSACQFNQLFLFYIYRYWYLHEPMDDSTSLSSLNSADFILIGKEQPRLKVAAGKCRT